MCGRWQCVCVVCVCSVLYSVAWCGVSGCVQGVGWYIWCACVQCVVWCACALQHLNYTLHITKEQRQIHSLRCNYRACALLYCNLIPSSSALTFS